MESTVPRVLLVEDEPLIAMTLEAIVWEAGFQAVGPAASRDAAFALLREESVDAAIIDYRLGDEHADDLADELDRRSIPWLLATGFGRDALPARYASVPLLAKPFGEEDVRRALNRLIVP